MTVTITVNGLTLTHRGSGGVSRNTLPDVCRTPPYGVPVAYSNTAYSRDLAQGTTTVFADGGNMIANYGSIFAISTGDEPGSMGGVRSGTFVAEADWITHSLDVYFEGKGACRLTDKMYMNHRNTVNMAGEHEIDLKGRRKGLQDWVCECQDEVKPAKNDGTLKTCTDLGNERHECMEKKKAEQNAADEKAGKKPTHGQEKGYKVKDGKIERVDDIHDRRLKNPDRLKAEKAALERETRVQEAKVRNARNAQRTYRHHRGGAGAGRSFGGIESAMESWAEDRAEKFFTNTYMKEQAKLDAMDKKMEGIDRAMENPNAVPRHAEHSYPDGSVLDKDGKIVELSEYKFICDKGNPTWRKDDGTVGPPSKGTSLGPWGRGQEADYGKLMSAMKKDGLAGQKAKVQKYSAADCPGKGGKNSGGKSSKSTKGKKR